MAEKKTTTSSVKTPFQVIDALFEIEASGRYGQYDHTESQFKQLTDKDKQRNFFITNRRLAINYPLQAFRMSTNGINPIYAIDSWYMITRVLAKKYKKKPSWLYLKTAKNKKEKALKISPTVKDLYMKLNQITEKQFETALIFEPDKMRDYLKLLDKQLKIIEKNKTR